MKKNNESFLYTLIALFIAFIVVPNLIYLMFGSIERISLSLSDCLFITFVGILIITSMVVVIESRPSEWLFVVFALSMCLAAVNYIVLNIIVLISSGISPKIISYLFLADIIMILANILLYFKVACIYVVPEGKLVIKDGQIYDESEKFKRYAFLGCNIQQFNKITKAILEFEMKVLSEEFTVGQYIVKPAADTIKRRGEVVYKMSCLYDRTIFQSLQDNLKKFEDNIKLAVSEMSIKNPQTISETLKREWRIERLSVENSILLLWDGKIDWKKDNISI